MPALALYPLCFSLHALSTEAQFHHIDGKNNSNSESIIVTSGVCTSGAVEQDAPPQPAEIRAQCSRHSTGSAPSILLTERGKHCARRKQNRQEAPQHSSSFVPQSREYKAHRPHSHRHTQHRRVTTGVDRPRMCTAEALTGQKAQ